MAGKALKRSFEFRPNGSDVGKPIAVKQLRATIGRSGCFRAAISMTCKRDEEPTIIERQDSQTPFLEGTHLGIKRVEARTGFDQSD